MPSAGRDRSASCCHIDLLLSNVDLDRRAKQLAYLGQGLDAFHVPVMGRSDSAVIMFALSDREGHVGTARSSRGDFEGVSPRQRDTYKALKIKLVSR